MAGRPKKEINKKTFEGLCKILCTEDEICSVLNVTDKPLNNWCKEIYGCNFSDIYKKLSETGKTSLRRYQFNIAKTNPTMAIWLGKQYLNQRDKTEIENNNIDRVVIINDLPSDEYEVE